MPLKDLSADSQPREKLLARGPAARSDAELLALLLALKAALALVDVRVLDHVVVAPSQWLSMAATGLV